MKQCILFFLLFFQMGQAVVVGSNTAVSKQERVFFPQVDADNSIIGFTVLYQGFTFENNLTSCIYDAFFHISGDVALNGGVLHLNQNIEFKSPVQFGSGTIQANRFSVLFPDNLSQLNFPSVNTKLLALLDQLPLGAAVYSVDWSWDNQYVAVATAGSGSNPELRIYQVENDAFSFITSSNVFGNNNVNSVRWHPSSYYLAIGQSGLLLTDQLRTFSFDVSGETLSQIDSVSGLSVINAVEWSPTGDYLAVGRQVSTQVSVYPVANGVLGTVINGSLPVSVSVIRNGISWDSSENYLAIGTGNALLGAEVIIFDFNGSALSAAGTIEIGADVSSVSWRPNALLLAVGHAGAGDRLQLFEYDPDTNTLTEQTSARVGQQVQVYSTQWSNDGIFLLIGIDNNAFDNELEVYSYDASEETLHLEASYALNNLVYSARFDGDALYIATGDSGNNLSLFSFKDSYVSSESGFAFIFEDAKIFFKSDVTLYGPILLKGDCIINGGNNTVSLADDGALVVFSGGSLVLEDMILKGMKDTNIRCLDDACLLSLRDIQWQQDDAFTFTTGALQIQDEVVMRGRQIFGYETSQPCILVAHTRFTLDQGFTFSYSPSNQSTMLFQFEDDTAHLVLNRSTFSAYTGIELFHGSLDVEAHSFMYTDTTFGIVLGNEVQANDFEVTVFEGAGLEIDGAFKYKNTQSNFFNTINANSRLLIRPNSRLEIFQDMIINPGAVEFYDNTILARAEDKDILGSIIVFGVLNYEDL